MNSTSSADNYNQSPLAVRIRCIQEREYKRQGLAFHQTPTMIALQSDFPVSLYKKYSSALADKHLVFNGENAKHETILSEVKGSLYCFQLTELQSLQHRPEVGLVDKNPFADPEPQLTVVPIFGEEKEFRIVLNKFPVVPAHFMLVTREFKSQNSPLSPSDLYAVYKVLNNLEVNDGKKKWFAFYNCGPQSGASQPHKHIQFMTLPENYTPFSEKLADSSPHFIPDHTQEPLQDANLPFAHFLAKLPNAEEITEDVLAMAFVSLLQRVITVLKDHDANHISYNFIATTKYIMLVPRSKGKFNDMLGINSCGFMGLLLCKNSDQIALVKSKGPETILGSVGFPGTSGQKTDEYHY